MSIASISTIMCRIATATEASPIAVFGLPEKCGKLDAVFGATVISQRLSKTDQRFIGMFHRKMEHTEVKKRLLEASSNPRADAPHGKQEKRSPKSLHGKSSL